MNWERLSPSFLLLYGIVLVLCFFWLIFLIYEKISSFIVIYKWATAFSLHIFLFPVTYSHFPSLTREENHHLLPLISSFSRVLIWGQISRPWRCEDRWLSFIVTHCHWLSLPVTDCHWLSLIVCDFLRFSLIVSYCHGLSLNIGGFLRFPVIVSDCQWLLIMHSDCTWLSPIFPYSIWAREI